MATAKGVPTQAKRQKVQAHMYRKVTKHASDSTLFDEFDDTPVNVVRARNTLKDYAERFAVDPELSDLAPYLMHVVADLDRRRDLARQVMRELTLS